MSSADKLLKRNSEGIVIPQYYNPSTDSYEAAEGQNGSLKFVGGVVKAYTEGSGNSTWNVGGNTCTGFIIKNDSDTDITFTIGSITVTVKPGEAFSEEFAKFTSVAITAAAGKAWRAYAKA